MPATPLTYYVAASIDGFIAHPDGSWDGFTQDPDFVAWYLTSLGAFDTVVMGRRTYQVGLDLGVTDPYPQMDRTIVCSRTITDPPDPAVTVTADDPTQVVAALRRRPGRGIWLCGGADLAGQLLAADLIDRLVIKVNPIVLGQGIPLFAGTTSGGTTSGGVASPPAWDLVDRAVHTSSGVQLLTWVRPGGAADGPVGWPAPLAADPGPTRAERRRRTPATGRRPGGRPAPRGTDRAARPTGPPPPAPTANLLRGGHRG